MTDELRPLTSEDDDGCSDDDAGCTDNAIFVGIHPMLLVFPISFSEQELIGNFIIGVVLDGMRWLWKIIALGIRYGKYCGVGWTGCPGEKPCDELDACCQIHDKCVEEKGMTNVKCHEKFKRCIKKVQKSGKAGFSIDCPYDTAVPTMQQGMDMAILFSQFGNSKLEL
ncbi:hypothetical protein R6Q59_017533 [Mikania micrantha]